MYWKEDRYEFVNWKIFDNVIKQIANRFKQK